MTNLLNKFIALLILLTSWQGLAESKTEFTVENLFQGDDVIWGFDFLDADRLLFSERKGPIKVLHVGTKKLMTLTGSPSVWATGQGGMLDIRRDPRDLSRVYFTYSEPSVKSAASTSLGTARIRESELSDFKRLIQTKSTSSQEVHFGSRIEFDQQGHLWMTVGDRGEREKAQDLKVHNGKTLRLKLDGTIPKDNPFVKSKDALPEIWSLGHRNPQGLARHPETGDLWLAEMGPRGGDELNLIVPQANYGWPEVTYGREYSGPTIGVKEKPGTIQPVAYWAPSISPSGICFYTGNKFPAWKGNLFMGTLSGQHLRRLVIKGKAVVEQESLLENLNLRIRNIRTGPDGFLYFSTDDGKIARLVPKR